MLSHVVRNLSSYIQIDLTEEGGLTFVLWGTACHWWSSWTPSVSLSGDEATSCPPSQSDPPTNTHRHIHCSADMLLFAWVSLGSMWTYCGWSLDQVLQLGVAELQADDIIELLSLTRRGLIVTCPLGHGHLCPLLSAHVHHVNHTSATWDGVSCLVTVSQFCHVHVRSISYWN